MHDYHSNGTGRKGRAHFATDKRLIGIFSVFLLAGAVLLTIMLVSTNTISALRSYSTLQTHWTEIRKEAVAELESYAITGEPVFYKGFKKKIGKLEEFSRVREELESDRPNSRVIFSLLKSFQFREREIQGMINVYRRFGELPDFASAIDNWIKSDQYIVRLDSLAGRINGNLASGSDPVEMRSEWLQKIDAIDRNLTDIQYALAANMEQGTQSLKNIVLWSAVGTGLLLFLVGGFMGRRYMSAREKARRKIHSQLEEKTVLLAEVHHRVKNNLAFVSALLMLREEQIDHEPARKRLVEAQNQIVSIADIHEIIYNTDNFSELSIEEYSGQILSRISDTFDAEDKNIRYRVSANDTRLTINEAIPFGLIINELATNSYKHAFRGRDEGLIELVINSKNGLVEVIYRDNGEGLPSEFDFDRAAESSLGMKLVQTFLQQLDANYKVRPDYEGFALEFRFEI